MDNKEFDKEMLQSLPVAVVLMNMEGKIEFLNSRFVELFGYTIKNIPTIDDWFKVAYPEREYRNIISDLWKNNIKNRKSNLKAEWSEIVEIKCKSGKIRKSGLSFKIKNNSIVSVFYDLSDNFNKREIALNERFFTSTLVKRLPGIFFIYEYLEGEFLLRRWNENLVNLTEYSQDSLDGINLTSFFTDEYARIVYDSSKKIISDGIHREITAPIKRKDNSIIPYYWVGDRLIFDNKTYLVGQGINITKQIESEGNFKAIFDNLPDAIIISKSKEEPLLAANKAFSKLIGYSKDEFVKNLAEFIKQNLAEFEKSLKVVHNFINSDKISSEIVEHGIVTKSGERNSVNTIFTKILFDNSQAILTIIRDVTKQKKTENDLLISEKRMSTIFDSAPVIMMVVNKDGEILQINKKGKKILNLANSSIDQIAVGKAYNCINSLESNLGCGFSSQCRDCAIRNTIINSFDQNKDFEKVSVEIKSVYHTYNLLMSSSILQSDNSKEILLTFDDITKQKKIEEDLRESREKAIESDKLKSAFLQNMSHEIRTPLNGILGFSNLLNSDELTNEDKEYYIEVINQSSNQLLGIVDDILNISRLETGQIEVISEEVSINNIIQELTDFYSHKFSEKKITLSYSKELGDIESIIYCDQEKLRQVLISLLNNAFKFTSQGHILFGYELKDKYLEFYVEDSGIGIDPQYHRKIFDRFQQVDSNSTRVYGGTGLGLAIAKGNVELLEGEIWLESAPDIGSKFVFTIPYKPVHIKLMDLKPRITDEEAKNQETILVAEDEEINFLFIAEALKNSNYKLLHALNGKEALDMFKKDKNIVLALLDIKMPVMDGYEALDAIHEINPKLPVIAQTAYAMLSDREKILKAGFSDYLSKPIKKVELLKAIDNHLKQKQ